MLKYPQTESTTLEFKADVLKNDQIIRTIIGFCNLYGGQLVLGVDDQGDIRGIPDTKAEELLESLSQTIFQACSPNIIPSVYLRRFADKVVLIIEVSSGMNKPYFRSSEGIDNGTYIRIGRSTIRASREIIEELRWRNRGISFDQTPIYQAEVSVINNDEVLKFLQSRAAGFFGHVDDKILHDYQIVCKEHAKKYPTIAGALLFGNNPQRYLSEAFIIASRFPGAEVGKASATLDCTGRLFEQFEKAYNFILENLQLSYDSRNRRRVTKFEIPSEAIREALVNAIVHRSYALNAPTKVAVFNDRVEIFSPGLLAGPINIRELGNGVTFIRNLTIAKIMREAGYVEKLGTGFRVIFDSCQKAGLKRPTVVEGDNFVKCILWRTKELGSEKSPILALFEFNELLSRQDICSVLGVSPATAGRQLSKLVSEGKIIRIGNGPGTKYRSKS